MSNTVEAFRNLARHAIREQYSDPVIVRYAGMDVPAGMTAIDGVEIVASHAFPPDRLYVMERDEFERILNTSQEAL